MDNQPLCKYRFKFYLNGDHSVIIDGKQGEAHPHTWEFALDILVSGNDLLNFSSTENVINAFFNRYQNQTLNNVEPFNAIMPILENMVRYFGSELRKIVRATGGELIKIEGSETPTRSFIVTYSQTADYLANVEEAAKENVSDVLDHFLDGVLF